MSLINEALKRARVEAARRDAAAKGVPPSALPVYAPHRQRPWLGPLAGFLGGLAAVAFAGLVFWLAWVPAPVTTVAAPASVSAPSPSPSPSPSPPATRRTAEDALPVARTPPPEPRAAGAAAAAPAVDPRPSSTPQEPSPKVATESDARPAGAAGEPPASRRVEPARAKPLPDPQQPALVPAPATVEEGRIYFVEAQPAGGKRVKLDFIVWSESRPFAQINGKQIGPGQTVDGYRLLQVERERVELERDGRTFWLRAR